MCVPKSSRHKTPTLFNTNILPIDHNVGKYRSCVSDVSQRRGERDRIALQPRGMENTVSSYNRTEADALTLPATDQVRLRAD
jgi:hypothetical protein